MCQCSIDRFLEQRSKSLAAKLMCPRNDKLKILHGKDKACYCSIAFNAFCGGHLDALDDLFEEFQIETRGTTDFKNRVKEDWLKEVSTKNEERIRKKSSNVMSALSELVVAKQLKNNGYNIVDLEAWRDGNGSKPDIKCKKVNEDFNIEVKYLGIPPEVQEYINRQIKTGEGDGIDRDEQKLVNFCFIRIAEAAMQLRHYNRNLREVWLLFSLDLDREIFEGDYLQDNHGWFNDALSVFDELFKEDSEKKGNILSKTPMEWLEEANTLAIGTMKNWSLKDVKEHQFTKR